MFFVSVENELYCTFCAMNVFAQKKGKDFNTNTIQEFIRNVKNGYDAKKGWREDQPENILEEVRTLPKDSRCSWCKAPLVPLQTKPMVLTGPRFGLSPENGEWLPRHRQPLLTDLPDSYDRTNFVPFEAVIWLERGMRVLVVTEHSSQHCSCDDDEDCEVETWRTIAYGSVAYVTDSHDVIILLDELPAHIIYGREPEYELESYPLAHAGLYLDKASTAQYRAIADLVTFKRVHLWERRKLELTPYQWQFEVSSLDLKWTATTFREGIAEIYTDLCQKGHIKDPESKPHPFREAVAALLYNLIYDQEGRDGWTPISTEPDPTYRAAFRGFAGALLHVLASDPEAEDKDIVYKARDQVNNSGVNASWQWIAIDETLHCLWEEAIQHIYAIESFLVSPELSVESAFLGEEAYAD